MAARNKLIPSMIFSDQTVNVIGQKLPASVKAFSAIKGVGPQKASQFGTDVLTLIRNYQNQRSGSAEQVSLF
ncbi:MAG: HRDC domain-containing protein [Daejeonella sp.]